MNGTHPKRRKDKYNPYTIWTSADGRHWLAFTDGQGIYHEMEISVSVFEAFDRAELDELSYLNEVDRHLEHAEVTEDSLYKRAFSIPQMVEEIVFCKMEKQALHSAIEQLPLKQRSRLYLYFFQELTYDEIAAYEGCSKTAIKHSIDRALDFLKKILNSLEKEG